MDRKERISKQTKQEGKNKFHAAKTGASQYDKCKFGNYRYNLVYSYNNANDNLFHHVVLSGGLSEGSQRRLATKDLLQEDLNKTRNATASLGKFDRKLQNEKAPKRGKQKVCITLYCVIVFCLSYLFL